jgi:copper chaperone
MMPSQTYPIKGMTCDHCAASVKEEVERVDGVTATEVDLGAGLLTVSGEGFAEQAIREAVDEAGYEVATAGA